jgi:hypothetical protein
VSTNIVYINDSGVLQPLGRKSRVDVPLEVYVLLYMYVRSSLTAWTNARVYVHVKWYVLSYMYVRGSLTAWTKKRVNVHMYK